MGIDDHREAVAANHGTPERALDLALALARWNLAVFPLFAGDASGLRQAGLRKASELARFLHDPVEAERGEGDDCLRLLHVARIPCAPRAQHRDERQQRGYACSP